jgi:hypothetical protein
MKKYTHYSCSFCGNDWTIEDGYNPATKQCPSCDAYDREEPARKAERDRQSRWWQEEGRHIESYLRLKHG